MIIHPRNVRGWEFILMLPCPQPTIEIKVFSGVSVFRFENFCRHLKTKENFKILPFGAFFTVISPFPSKRHEQSLSNLSSAAAVGVAGLGSQSYDFATSYCNYYNVGAGDLSSLNCSCHEEILGHSEA